MRDNIQVSILGRNEIVREGLRRILTEQSFNVLDVVQDAEHLTSDNENGSLNCLFIVDSTTDKEGLDTCRQLRQRFPGCRVVIMADNYRLDAIARAFEAGADGYLVKAISCEPLAGALNLIALGEKVVPTQVVESLTNMHWQPASGDWEASRASVNLSDREIEILQCLVCGEANKVIARRLDITEATVKVHIKAILRKLNVLNRTQAAIWAVMRGIGDDDHRIAACN
ncbi:response regulator transcription factor [Sphingomonas sp. LaA6.9]|uniref:response regulator transcription factor n=1 Tax=Sphingomonas sp. LaA6.9 TaxID=2919914 RepID=UPI001F5002F2|nr:response regulator transcription factor [Sphingomonas sp. LaA6.9]MCJ8158782.1 response regulator transcription factor [Sphingomonas sp. LaA6.9]